MSNLKEQPWSVIGVYDDVDDALDHFQTVFIDTLNDHAVEKVKRVKRINQPDWFSNQISSAIKDRDHAKKVGDDANYKRLRNEVKNLIIKSKKSFYSETINNKAKTPKILWKNLKDLSGQSKTHQTNFINNDPIETAEVFNNFFSDIFKTPPEVENNQSNKQVILDYIEEKIKHEQGFTIPNITESFIKTELKSLDTSKATGLDGISAKFLKLSHEVKSY